MQGCTGKKALEPYHPNAKRNRLPTDDFKIPYKNSSSIQLGEANFNTKSHFRSVGMVQNTHQTSHPITNQGIIAEMKKEENKFKNR